MLSELGYIENELRLPLVAVCDETKQQIIEELERLKVQVTDKKS
ncbi:hypothetical protein SDC9_124733 [bioreactor metagenome]|uniref:4-hydroxy-tetrahydrodipicolinate synthase n=2 Tax=root TaxID=1 RepID=A0A645CLA9_9ZZZZ